MGDFKRTIVGAMCPHRYEDSFTEIWLKVWFEELDFAVPFLATVFDCEGHGRELWFRAMKGEYGEIEVIGPTCPLPKPVPRQYITMAVADSPVIISDGPRPLPAPRARLAITMQVIDSPMIISDEPKLLEYHP
jgi:hypothetical protein